MTSSLERPSNNFRLPSLVDGMSTISEAFDTLLMVWPNTSTLAMKLVKAGLLKSVMVNLLTKLGMLILTASTMALAVKKWYLTYWEMR